MYKWHQKFPSIAKGSIMDSEFRKARQPPEDEEDDDDSEDDGFGVGGEDIRASNPHHSLYVRVITFIVFCLLVSIPVGFLVMLAIMLWKGLAWAINL